MESQSGLRKGQYSSPPLVCVYIFVKESVSSSFLYGYIKHYTTDGYVWFNGISTFVGYLTPKPSSSGIY